MSNCNPDPIKFVKCFRCNCTNFNVVVEDKTIKYYCADCGRYYASQQVVIDDMRKNLIRKELYGIKE